VVLENDRTAPGTARRRVTELVGDHPRIDDLVLCVSEVVTNAVNHAGTLTHLVLDSREDVVRVEVVDQSPGSLPRRETPTASSPSGRGVGLVEALADRWGVEVGGAEKSVWFEFDVAR